MDFLTIGVGLIGLFMLSGVRLVKEYDRLVIFTLGKATDVKGPGPVYLWPIAQSEKKVDLRVVTMAIPMQEVITKDNISCKTAAVCFFMVVDPLKAVTKVEDWYTATNQIAQTTLRSVLGQHELDDLLSERDVINAKLSSIIDRQTEGWGIQVTAVEVKDVELPESMQRAMARQAEAERERRAKITAAEGELQAAEKLAQAANLIASAPGAMQLRQLQTMVEVAGDAKATVILPIPIEMMEGFNRGGQTIKLKAQEKEKTTFLKKLDIQAKFFLWAFAKSTRMLQPRHRQARCADLCPLLLHK